MRFFQKFFHQHNWQEYSEEVAVRCPFPHYDVTGKAYFEQNASAHINTSKDLFHCKTCDTGLTEVQFVSKLNGISMADAKKLTQTIEEPTMYEWSNERKNLLNNSELLHELLDMGIGLQTIKDLQMGYEGYGVSFPVYMFDQLLDVRTYNVFKNPKYPKVKSRKGAKSGLIIPFDLWRKDSRTTILCAGEKDMALARSLGYNAITFTGGEKSFPSLWKREFANRKVYIVYDNDPAGLDGAFQTAAKLKEVGAIVHVVTGHHHVCIEKGEDLYDFFMKYKQSTLDFDMILEKTKEFSEAEYERAKEKQAPSSTLLEATRGENRNKLLRSDVQIVANFDGAYGFSDFVEITDSEGNTSEWSLHDDNTADVLLLADSGLKADDVRKNYLRLAGMDIKRKCRVKKVSHSTLYKCVVTDTIEKKRDGTAPTEITAYSFQRLETGKKYKLTYKPVSHPLNAQQIVLIVTRIESSSDTVTNFVVTQSVKDSLKCFQGDVFEKMTETYERSKGLIGSFANEHIVHAVDLTFNSPPSFRFGRHEVKGMLDVFIVGESRTGKSATAQKLVDTYELGTFTTLKNATVAGVIGGSNKVQGSFKTTIGTLPREHGGLVVFEEFSGASHEFIRTLTDVRSSGKVRLTRVNGELTLPATVRMVSLSNQRTQKNITKPLKNYANGVQILTELIGAAEDIARYDFFVLVGEPDFYDDPLSIVEDPYAHESYKNRVRWAWSRTSENIRFLNGVERHIVDESRKLNDMFHSHIKFFGAEAWKKLARVSVAVACATVSTDENFEDVLVSYDHVDWAVEFLKELYDNDLFRLRQYVMEQEKFNNSNDDVVVILQNIYEKCDVLVDQLENVASIASRNLFDISGLDRASFGEILKQMSRFYLITWQGDNIVPSARFRDAMKKISKATRLKRIGES